MTVKQVFNTSAELDYPTVLPTLDLDFANSKTLDPRITFTRASGGSYVGADGLIKYAGVNEPRFDHDPVTGESLGLLIEESRTNLVSYSTYNPSPWWVNVFPVNATLSTGIDAPDGSNTAVRFSCTPTGNSLLRLVYPTFTPNGTDTYTISFYVRLISGNTSSNGQLTTDLADGTPSGNYLPNLITNQWVRVSFSGVPTAVSKNNFDLLSNNSNNYVLDFWGAQLEQGAFPTSYIPTEASTRTRAADNASITGKNFSEWYRQDEGTIYSQFKTQLNIINNIWSINNYPATTFATTTNYFRLLTLSNIIHTQYNVGGTNLYPQFSLANNNSQKVTQSYNINSSPITSALNGTIGTGSGNIYATSPGFNQLEFGKNTDARTTIGQYTISQLTYFPKRLTNAQLQALTS